MSTVTILWRRLDTPGHDVCMLAPNAEGWELSGTAVFSHEGSPAHLSYRLTCDHAWRTQEGTVRGWIGVQPMDIRVVRAETGIWTQNGIVVPDLERCVDLDLGFTPATNVFQLRRVGLAVGQGVDVPVAWLDLPAGTLDVLQQRYERRSESSYWYEAPRFAYAALLEIAPTGFVQRYPNLWEAETLTGEVIPS